MIQRFQAGHQSLSPFAHHATHGQAGMTTREPIVAPISAISAGSLRPLPVALLMVGVPVVVAVVQLPQTLMTVRELSLARLRLLGAETRCPD